MRSEGDVFQEFLLLFAEMNAILVFKERHPQEFDRIIDKWRQDTLKAIGKEHETQTQTQD